MVKIKHSRHFKKWAKLGSSYLPFWLFKTIPCTLLPSVHGTFSSCFLLLAHQTFDYLGVYFCLIDCQLLLLILPIYARNIPIFSSRKLYSILGDHVFCFRHRTFSILKSLKFKLNLTIKQLFQEEFIFQQGLNDDRFHILSQKAQCLFQPISLIVFSLNPFSPWPFYDCYFGQIRLQGNPGNGCTKLRDVSF